MVAAGTVSCSSSGGTSTAGTSGATAGGPKTFTVGLLTDLTGLGGSINKSSVDGVKAGAFFASRNGYTIKYVVADTGTNPAAVMPAVQKLVLQEHVGAVIAISALTQLAATYLTARKIPVVGAGEDGPEWLTAMNMFSVFGAQNITKVSTTFGELLKLQGVTNLGALGYGVSPVSSEAAKAVAASAQAAGIKVGYLNANFPFGSTDVAPVAIAMKNAGVDGVTATTSPNTILALITALKQQGVHLKAAVLATGYGSDLLQAGPGAVNAAQGIVFNPIAEPFAMNTAATKQFAGDLKSAGITTNQATYAQYAGYMSVGLVVRALKDAGAKPTNASIISALSQVSDWDGVGMFGAHTIDVNDRTSYVAGPDNCSWAMKLAGTNYTLVPGADPICGTVIPGKTVSSSS